MKAITDFWQKKLIFYALFVKGINFAWKLTENTYLTNNINTYRASSYVSWGTSLATVADKVGDCKETYSRLCDWQMCTLFAAVSKLYGPLMALQLIEINPAV